MPIFKDWRPAEDAVAVARVKAAGAVILGKTNVPFALVDWQSYNDIYGTTNNPWDPGRTPGGSSGGSAASLVMGYASLELGSDIGGSLRAPAHYGGVYAHKPTYALVPSRGTPHQAYLPRLKKSISPSLDRWRAAPTTLRWRSICWQAPTSRTLWRIASPSLPLDTTRCRSSGCWSSTRIRCCRRRTRCAPRSSAGP